MNPGTLYYGDCLDWMGRWPDECVDLVYLDPPFNSKTNYNVLYAAESAGDAQMRAFTDTWAMGRSARRADGPVRGGRSPSAARPHHAACSAFLGPSGNDGLLDLHGRAVASHTAPTTPYGLHLSALRSNRQPLP